MPATPTTTATVRDAIAAAGLDPLDDQAAAYLARMYDASAAAITSVIARKTPPTFAEWFAPLAAAGKGTP
jgi:hypothetical protein